MALDARSLKRRYAGKWRVSARRELLVWNLLNFWLPPRYRVVLGGVGAGVPEYLAVNYGSVYDAFDLIVFDVETGKPAAFIDVTGFESEHKARDVGGKQLCVLEPKIWKAEKFKVLDNAWAVHVADKRVSLRFTLLAYIKQHGKRVKLLRDERNYLCLSQQAWKTISDFIRWLTGVRL